MVLIAKREHCLHCVSVLSYNGIGTECVVQFSTTILFQPPPSHYPHPVSPQGSTRKRDLSSNCREALPPPPTSIALLARRSLSHPHFPTHSLTLVRSVDGGWYSLMPLEILHNTLRVARRMAASSRGSSFSHPNREILQRCNECNYTARRVPYIIRRVILYKYTYIHKCAIIYKCENGVGEQ